MTKMAMCQKKALSEKHKKKYYKKVPKTKF